ncbi:phosphotransferase family protein [Salipiger abyssi]|uniref:Phosphotransferase family protein n=1 Tax=Salipiger abyssi TaxID=1250539 RepID=A0A1P8UYB6_9RHOB|nr:phosphotransferase [Salipiger abyssi]APZ54377.1 phosphotransferase family protein [Salipiger abyssi]
MTGPAGATHLDKPEARALARAALAERRPGRDYGLGCLKNIDKPLRAQVFCAAHPEERLTVKVFAPAGAEKARAQAARQAAVAGALPGRAPDVLFFDEARLVLGMTYADGPSLAALWPHLSADEARARLEDAGRWLAALHDLSAEAHPFRPKGQIAWLHRLLGWHAEGKRAIPEIAAFRAEVAALEALALELRGRPARRAVTHRDLHLSNLVATDTGLVGLDFENDRPDEPLRDLVALLVDAMAQPGTAEDLHRSAEALRRGYGETGTDPQVSLVLQRLFALGIWAATPDAPSLRQSARYLAAREILAAEAPLFA